MNIVVVGCNASSMWYPPKISGQTLNQFWRKIAENAKTLFEKPAENLFYVHAVGW